jgi:hypothetical protein
MQDDVTTEIDLAFLDVFRDLTAATLELARDGTQRVVDLSTGFLGAAVGKAVRDFQALYFGDAALNASAEAINREVDDLVDALQSMQAAGDDLSAAGAGLVEDEAAKASRLSLSGLHRQLESLVQLDAHVKEQLVPVLAAMQFEDLLRHRLRHVADAWELVVMGLVGGAPLDVAATARTVAATLSSQAERVEYYREVLREPPPAGLDDGLIHFDLG